LAKPRFFWEMPALMKRPGVPRKADHPAFSIPMAHYGLLFSDPTYKPRLFVTSAGSNPHITIEIGLRVIYNVSRTARPEEMPMKVDVYSSPT
jgi:hypothetical protein